MTQRILHIRVGLFVLFGLSLVVAGVVILGLGRLFRDTIPVETYIDESVQGLAPGAPVKFRGVPIGSVSSVSFLSGEYPVPPEHERFSLAARMVLVRLALEPEKLAGATFDTDVTIRRMIAGGLRVRLASTGLTGIAYLELSYLDAADYPPVQLWFEPKALYLPSAPSTITQLTNSAEGIIRQIEGAQLDALISDAGRLTKAATQLVGELQTLTGDVRSSFRDGELGAMVRDGAAAMAEVRGMGATAGRLLGKLDQAVDEKSLKATLSDAAAAVANLNAATDDLRQLTSQVQDATAGGRMRAVIAAALGAVDDVGTVARAAAKELPAALVQLNGAAAGVQTLALSLKDTLVGEDLRVIVTEARQSAERLRLGADRIPQTIELTNKTLRRVGELVAGAQGDIAGVVDNLVVIAENLRQLSTTARSYPSQIPFGAPPPRTPYEGGP